MATVREKRVVEIVVDAKQFKAAAKDVNRNLREMSKQAQRTADTFRGMFSIWALFETARIVRDIIMMVAEVERLDTVMRGAVGSQENFANSMEFLRGTAEEFGLKLSDLQTGYSSLAGAGRAMGMSMEEINHIFTGLSVSAAAFQVSGAELQLMLQGAQQLAGSATVNMEDLRQVMERIPNALEATNFAVREMTGNLSLTSGEIKKLIAEGKVATDEFLPIFTQRLEDINIDAATRNAETFRAELNLLDNQFKELVRVLIEGGVLKGLGELVGLLTSLIEESIKASNSIGDFVNDLENLKVFEKVGDWIDTAAEALSGFDAVVEDVSRKAPGLTQVITAMVNPFNFLGQAAEYASIGINQVNEAAKGLIGPTGDTVESLLREQISFGGGAFDEELQRLLKEQDEFAGAFGSGTPKPSPGTPAGGGAGGGSAAEEAEDYTDALQALQEQLDPTIESWREYAEVTILLDNARQQGLITLQQQTDLERQAGVELQKNLEELKDTAEELPALAMDIGDAFIDAFGNMITGAVSFEDALASLEAQLIEVITQALILEPLQRGLGAAFAGEDIFAAAFGGGITGLLARQGGGAVQAGRPYMVGEAGPEVVIPRQSGTVVPNNRIGGQTIVVNFNAPVQGEGLRQSAQQIAAQTGAQVNRAVRRNG